VDARNNQRRSQSQKGSQDSPVDRTRARRKIFCWQNISEVFILLLLLLPVFFIGMAAGSKNHWLSWLERIGVSESWGKETANVPPAATWQGEGVADFGKISVRTYDPVSGLIREVDFRLHAVMGFSERDEFETFIRRTGYAIRDEILVTVRASTLPELSDAELLGRKIATRVNRVFGADTIRSVQISDLGITEGAAEPDQN
jgi:hypothetical protein